MASSFVDFAATTERYLHSVLTGSVPGRRHSRLEAAPILCAQTLIRLNEGAIRTAAILFCKNGYSSREHCAISDTRSLTASNRADPRLSGDELARSAREEARSASHGDLDCFKHINDLRSSDVTKSMCVARAMRDSVRHTMPSPIRRRGVPVVLPVDDRTPSAMRTTTRSVCRVTVETSLASVSQHERGSRGFQSTTSLDIGDLIQSADAALYGPATGRIDRTERRDIVAAITPF